MSLGFLSFSPNLPDSEKSKLVSTAGGEGGSARPEADPDGAGQRTRALG